MVAATKATKITKATKQTTFARCLASFVIFVFAAAGRFTSASGTTVSASVLNGWERETRP